MYGPPLSASVSMRLFLPVLGVAVVATGIAIYLALQMTGVATSLADGNSSNAKHVDMTRLTVPALEELAASDNSRAQRELAQRYRAGRTVARDSRKAFNWMLAAAEGGNYPAQRAVAEMYAYGWGVEADVAAASEWAARAERNPEAPKREERELLDPEDLYRVDEG